MPEVVALLAVLELARLQPEQPASNKHQAKTLLYVCSL
jgi:hypothetical protein